MDYKELNFALKYFTLLGEIQRTKAHIHHIGIYTSRTKYLNNTNKKLIINNNFLWVEKEVT